MKENLTFVHLTDLHLNAPGVVDDHLHSDTTATLQTILAQVQALRPSPAFIIASGDLTNRGDVASYLELKRIFAEAAIACPVIWAIGNHDTRPGFYEGMLGRSEDAMAPYFHDEVVAGIHVITLDTSIPGQTGGNIEPEQFAWLKERLDAHPEYRKLIVMHHGPGLDEDDPSMEWESITYADTRRLRDLLKPYDVLGILSGHLHYDRVADWYGIPVVMGIGQHAAIDPLWLHEGIRMVEATSFAIGTIRPSGLTVSFAPLPATRRELAKHRIADITAMSKDFYDKQAAGIAAE